MTEVDKCVIVFEYWFRIDDSDYHVTKGIVYDSLDGDQPPNDWIDDNLVCIFHGISVRFGFSRIWNMLPRVDKIAVTSQYTGEVILFESGDGANIYLNDIFSQVFV